MSKFDEGPVRQIEVYLATRPVAEKLNAALQTMNVETVARVVDECAHELKKSLELTGIPVEAIREMIFDTITKAMGG